MLRATLRGLAERKLRFALSVAAIVLGCALAGGTAVLGATVDRAFDRLFAERNAGVDVLVRAAPAFAGQEGGFVSRGQVPVDAVDVVRAVPGVGAAAGTRFGLAQLIDKAGQPIKSEGPPTLGIGWVDDGRLNQFTLVEGTPPRPGGVVIDVATARDAGFQIGDRVSVAIATGTQQFNVVGFARFGSEDGIPRTTVTLFDSDTAATALGQPGFDTVAVAAAGDNDPLAPLETAVQSALDQRYGQGSLEAILGTTASQEQADAVKDYFSFVTRALAAFSGAALFVGGFLILNTFTITLTQRTRELALLRAVGASRRQVFGGQIAEAAVIGLLSGAVGAAAGIGLAEGLRWLFEVAGATLPPGPLAVDASGLVRITLLGTAVTIAAALYPCWRATTVPPVVALADDAVRPTRHPIVRVVVGLLASAGGSVIVAAAVLGIGGSRLPLLGLGSLVAFIGVAALSVVLVRPLARLVGGRGFAVALAAVGALVVVGGVVATATAQVSLVTGALVAFLGAALAASAQAGTGLAGRLGQRNTSRSPRRSSATAAALMVGVGLVTFTAVIADSIQASVGTAIEAGVRADLVLSNDQATIPDTVVDGVRATVGDRATVSAVELTRARIAKARPDGSAPDLDGLEVRRVAAVDPNTFADGFSIHVPRAAVNGLSGGGVVLDDVISSELGLHTGDNVWLEFAGGQPVPSTVLATGADGRALQNARLFVDRGLSTRASADLGGTSSAPGVDVVGVTASDPEEDLTSLRTTVEDAVSASPQIDVRDQRELRADTRQQLEAVFTLVNILLGMSVLIALLGVANTVGLSVYERTREIGLLRAVGMGRNQVRGMVRWEAISVSTIGAILGVAVGCVLGAAAVRALADEGFRELSYPSGQLAAFVGAAAVAGAVAGWLPARRAAGLQVVEALGEVD
jgi:putative ABC transport system permease protein